MSNSDSFMPDNAQLVHMIYRFLAYIKMRDGADVPFSFQGKNTFLGREENYKAKAFSKAQEALQYEKWTESWITSGAILSCAHKAMNCAGNLVYPNQQIAFQNSINPEHEKYNPDASRALYNIYKSKEIGEEVIAFAEAKKVFGGSYDTIAYLFFIKDQSRFLPVSPGNFEKSLASVKIGYRLSGKCSWENYQGFINIVKTVQDVMQDVLPSVEIRLIDAHSFLWVINEDKRKSDFLNWKPDKDTLTQIEDATEKYIDSKATGNTQRKSGISSYFTRSAEVVKITKKRAKGICQLCGQVAPFTDNNGNPYLEAHHIVWLSRGGQDSTDNTVALCPNCHTKMHVLDDKQDVAKLVSANLLSRECNQQ